MSVNRRMDKRNVVCLHNGVLLGCFLKSGIMKFAGKQMELEKIFLSEISHNRTDKHGVYLLMYGY